MALRAHPVGPKCVPTHFVSTITPMASVNCRPFVSFPHVNFQAFLTSFPHLEFSRNSPWRNKNYTHNKTQLKGHLNMLSFSAPPAPIDLLHLASLYALGPRNFRVSVTHFFTAVYTVAYSHICISLASSGSLTACSTPMG